MGLRDIERKIRSKSAFQRKEAEMMLQQLDQMIENVAVLKDQLKKFEKSHGKEIQENKDYYQKIAELRGGLGLPGEIGIYEWKDSPSFKDKIGNKGYYDQLSNEILELGKSVISDTGGLISIAELVIKLNKIRPGKVVPPKDVIKGLDNLIDSKLIPPIRKLKSGVLVVEFVAVELSDDQELVFNLASKKGFLTQETLMVQLGWNSDRATRILEELVSSGMALKDESYQEGIKYWFPSLGQ